MTTEVVEGQDPRLEVRRRLLNYRNTPHPSTGKAPAELMMRRQIRTRVLGLMRPAQEKIYKEAKAQDKKTRKERKERYDEKNRVKECQIKPGDRVLMRQEKTTVKPPYDPNPYEVTEVKGAQITCSQGGKEKKRPKEKIKVIEERPEYLRSGGRTIRDIYTEDEIEVEINLNPEEDNPLDNLEGVGHPRPIEIIEIDEEDDGETEAETDDANREGVGHPRRENIDSEEEFNDAVEVTDETMEDNELPEGPEEMNNDVEDERQTDEQAKKQTKKKQPSPRERRTRSMAAAKKKRTPIKERWLFTR